MNDDYPGTLNFLPEVESVADSVRIPVFPAHYEHLLLKEALVSFTSGEFGFFSTQEIAGPGWAIGWLHARLMQPLELQLSVDRPLVAVICTLKGRMSFHLPGNDPFILQRRMYGFYYIPVFTGSTVLLTEGDQEAVYFSFSPAFLSSFVAQHPSFQQLYNAQQAGAEKGDVFPVFKMGIEERKMLDAIKNSNLSGPARQIYLGARISDLLVSYFTSLDTTEKRHFGGEDSRERFREIERYIKANYHQPLKIQFLSRKAGMNLRSFEKGFKAYFGIKAKEYIEQLRVKMAADMLKNGDMAVADIAYHVGFSGTNYFSFVFRKIQHCSPREYRRRYRQMKVKDDEIL